MPRLPRTFQTILAAVLTASAGLAPSAVPRAAAAAPPTWEHALAHAETTGVSILVEVGASWCHACNVFERETLADPLVEAALHDGWILVRVDVDRRPDLRRLFQSRGTPPRGETGLPTLHYLDSFGGERVRTGPVNALEMVRTLRYLRDHDGVGEPLVLPGDIDVPRRTPGEWFRHATARFRENRDVMFGGSGRGPKAIDADETTALIALAEADGVAVSGGGDREALSAFVDNVVASPLHDTREGGFHRYAERRDWSAPHWEKLLSGQAAMIEALTADARLHPERADANLAVVEETVRFLAGRLQDPVTGLFYASVNADVVTEWDVSLTGEEYYARGAAAPAGTAPSLDAEAGPDAGTAPSLDAEAGAGPPPAVPVRPGVDRTYLTSANARAAAALIDAGRLWKKRAWVKMGRRVRHAIPTVLVDNRNNLLHWKSAQGEGASGVEDWTEWGRLLLILDEEGDRAELRDTAHTIRRRFVDASGRLVPRGAPAAGEIAPLGNDAARTIRFLGRYADRFGDGEITFLALDLLDRLAAQKDPSAASLAIAAEPVARD